MDYTMNYEICQVRLKKLQFSENSNNVKIILDIVCAIQYTNNTQHE